MTHARTTIARRIAASKKAARVVKARKRQKERANRFEWVAPSRNAEALRVLTSNESHGIARAARPDVSVRGAVTLDDIRREYEADLEEANRG